MGGVPNYDPQRTFIKLRYGGAPTHRTGQLAMYALFPFNFCGPLTVMTLTDGHRKVTALLITIVIGYINHYHYMGNKSLSSGH
jgi:hypothetical protein